MTKLHISFTVMRQFMNVKLPQLLFGLFGLKNPGRMVMSDVTTFYWMNFTGRDLDGSAVVG